jgi:hypothetical protein
MKSLPQSNSESFSKIVINNQSNFKSRANQNSDFNSLFSVNNSNMDSIDKKIKNKYNSAIDYLNNKNNKRSVSGNQNLYNNERYIQLKKDMIFNFFDSNTDKYKNLNLHINFNSNNIQNNNNNQINKIYKSNNFFNSSKKTRTSGKDNIKKKIEHILNSQKKKEEETDENRINKSMNHLQTKSIYNEKTREKMKQIYEILKPKKDPKKKGLHYEVFEESLAAFKLRELREKKNQPSILNNFVNGIDDNNLNNNTSRYIKKINPHVDLYDNKYNNIENIQKSASCQRIIHMTKVLDSETKKNNFNEFDYGFKKKNINKYELNNVKKDLFAVTHERKIKNKLIDFNKFTIFPDIMRRKKDDGLLDEYAKNNLQIISGIKNDLAKSDNKNDNNNNNNIIEKNINNNNLKKKEVKFKEEIQENKINEKEDINIDDLL